MNELQKILVVDDDERVAHTFTRNLEVLGYQSLAASGGEEALRLFAQNQPDLALVDVRMPGMDGFAVLAAIRALNPEAEVILITGHGDIETAIEALRVGASDFLPKPLEQITLEAALRRTHERVRLKRALRQAEEDHAWEARSNIVMAELAATLLSSASLEEISALILARAKELTGSRFGFVAHIDPRTGAMISTTMTRDIWENCQMPDKSFIFEKFTGLWGWVLTHKAPILVNDLTTDPRSTGIPPGHIPIERFLGAPALHGDDLVGEVALANPERDYEYRALVIVQRLAALYALAVERQRAEDQLRLQSAALGAAANAIVITNQDGAIEWVNPAFTTLTGYTPEEAYGQNPRVLKSGQHPEAFYRELWETVLAGEVWRNELINRRKDGSLYTEEMTIAPVRDSHGDITHFVAVKQDVTARKEAEAALRRARDELEVRVQERTAALSEANQQLQMEITERIQAELSLKVSDQHQRALNALLRISLEDIPLEMQLQRALDTLLTLSWIPLISQGAILLTAEEGPPHLEMVVQRGLSDDWLTVCKHVPYNTCLCGRAASTRDIVFAADVDERHEIRPADIYPHGHYCVPILSGEQVLGVLTLYLMAGHTARPEETRFLLAAAQVLAVLIERKRAEMALRESQQQYATLVNSVEGIVWEADARTTMYTFVSSQAEQLLGYPLSQWLTEATFWAEHIHPDDCAWVHAYARQAIDEMRDYANEYRMVAADGRALWVRDMVAVVVEEGQIVKLRGLTIDVTERKRLEARLNAIYHLGQELPLLYDEEAIIGRTLETAERVIQADFVSCALLDERTDVLRHYHLDKEHAPSRVTLLFEHDSGVCMTVLRSGEGKRIADTTRHPDYIAPFPDQVYRAELCVPMKVGAQMLGVLNVESHATDAFTAADEQLLQTLANQTAVALTNARFYTRIQRHSREMTALNAAMHALASNLEIEIVLQQTLDEINILLDAEDVSILLLEPGTRHLVFVAGARRSKALVAVGQRIPLERGVAGWVAQNRQSALVSDAQADARFYPEIDEITGLTTRSLLAVPIMANENVIGVIEAINKSHGHFDAHDLELLEALSSSAAIALENARLYQDLQTQFTRLRDTQAQLIQSEKMSALGRLTASVAHEINNPLQAIQGCLTLAGEELAEEHRRERLERYLHMAESEIGRIAAIVRRVREFYRPAKHEWQLTDLHATLENIVELTRKQLQHSNVDVEYFWCGEAPAIAANANQLKQVFLNLMLNAIDAMPDGGTLTLTTTCDDNWARIAFRDTGIGMSPEVLSQLFEPFFTTKPHGSGLGLSVSYSIIEAHNGQIQVESKVGVGTTVTVLLPLPAPATT